MPHAPLYRSTQLLNALLRLLPLGAKLVLTLYMGKYFPLAAIGSYGLVFAAVTILNVLLGQRFDYVVTRDIIGDTPERALHKMRDQAVLYGLNYLALFLVIMVLIVTQTSGLATSTLIYLLVLTIIEGLGNMSYANMNSLNHQLLANALFFLRSGVWVLPVLVLCTLSPSLRTDETVFLSWSLGGGASVLATLYCWRNLPWRDVSRLPIDWAWMKAGLKKSSLIWLGAMGLVSGGYIDRFVVAHYLTMDAVGVLTFYASFTNAVLTLLQSGVLAFAYPKLITFHRTGETDAFWKETRNVGGQVAFGATMVALSVGAIVPVFGHVFHRMIFVTHISTLWLMLFATWLRANAETVYYVLFARHQDKPIWLGNLLFLIPAILGNLLFVPRFGLIGIGYDAVLSSALLLLWRWYFMKNGPIASPPIAS